MQRPAEDLKPQLLEMGILEVLIPLTNSPSIEVQGNSAAAIGNLSSKGRHSIFLHCTNDDDISKEGRSPSDDYSAFVDVWDKPDGGLHQYLWRFLSSTDSWIVTSRATYHPVGNFADVHSHGLHARIKVAIILR